MNRAELLKYIDNTDNLRNPVLNIAGIKLGVIGDPHIGRIFKTGVPKDRLGEREINILNHLEQLLNREVEVNVVVGDLLNAIRINNTSFYRLISIIEQSAIKHPSTEFVYINGNHDMPKNTDTISSFQLLERYFSLNQKSNVRFISQYTDRCFLEFPDLLLYFSHYNAFVELDKELAGVETKLHTTTASTVISFGHWETIDFGSEHFIDRKVPKIVSKYSTLVITGHEHTPKITQLEDTLAYTVGSMQPYAFGEELADEKSFYVTISATDLYKRLQRDPMAFKDSYVKMIRDYGDPVPEPFPCLSLTFKNNPKITPSKTQTVNNEAPSSFSASLFNLLDKYKESKPELSLLIDQVRTTFKDKSYKED